MTKNGLSPHNPTLLRNSASSGMKSNITPAQHCREHTHKHTHIKKIWAYTNTLIPTLPPCHNASLMDYAYVVCEAINLPLRTRHTHACTPGHHVCPDIHFGQFKLHTHSALSHKNTHAKQLDPREQRRRLRTHPPSLLTLLQNPLNRQTGW